MRSELDIWQISIFDAKSHYEHLIELLSNEEKEKAARFVNHEHGVQYRLAHAVLRDVLSYYTQQNPADITYHKGKHGKPYLDSKPLQFNLTHSRDRVLIAIHKEHEVGIDVEQIQKSHRFDDLIERFFSEAEREAYLKFKTAAERRMAFYRAWTRKEAYLKATGEGLSFPLHDFTVSLDEAEQHALINVCGDYEVHKKWTLFSWQVDDFYLASVAINASIQDWKIQDWQSLLSY